jgi:hypothetical protein
MDPPAAIKAAVARSCRRWRLNEIGQQLPALIPKECDIKGKSDTGTCLIDFAGTRTTLIKASKSNCDKLQWKKEYTPYLTSAMSGGQWTQARKAKVKKWNLTNECQLCKADAGTTEHRFRCSATVPKGGWPAAPVAARNALNKMTDDRRQTLKHHGVACVKVPRNDAIRRDWFTWLWGHPDPTRDDLIWYTDGSIINGRWQELLTAGYAMVVVDTKGSLVAYGHGVPPEFVDSAGHTEAWAIFKSLAHMVTPQNRH